MSQRRASKYRPLLIVVFGATFLNFLVQLGLGIELVPEHLTNMIVSDERSEELLASNERSYLASLVFQISITVIIFTLVLFRQVGSRLFSDRIKKIESSELLWAAGFLLICSVYFGPGNIEIYASDDLKVRSLANWVILLVITTLLAGATVLSLIFLMDPDTINHNEKVRLQKGPRRDDPN